MTRKTFEKAKDIINDIQALKNIKCEYESRHWVSYVFYNLKDVKDQCEKMCYYYGKKCYKDHPLGYDNGQLLIGFYYTVPNETLPIFWSDSNGWNRLFERYGKSNGLWRLIDELGRYV